MKTNARSRLQTNQPLTQKAKVKTKKSLSLVGSTLLFWGITIAIVIIFITLILPFIIKVTAQIKMKNSVKTTIAQVLQPPVINMPPDATSSAKIKISGFAPAHTNLTQIKNGTAQPEIINIPDSGEFSLDLLLNTGENTFSFYVSNDQGDESSPSPEFTILLDQEDPTITLKDELPQEINGSDNQNLTINGTTEPQISIYINDRRTTSNHEGEFSSNIYLQEGENIITIRAVDRALNENELVTKINFKL